MLVADLLSDPTLALSLETACSNEALHRAIRSCAPTEMLDPTAFLDPNALLLLNGIGMNFSEASVWEGYVERLKQAEASAIVFAAGIAHTTIPKALAAACQKHDLPLLNASPRTPLMRINHAVSTALEAATQALTAKGWQLATECASLTRQNATTEMLLVRIHNKLGAETALLDSSNNLLASFPEKSSWHNPATDSRVEIFNLPTGGDNPLYFAVRNLQGTQSLAAAVTPLLSVLALHLTQVTVEQRYAREQFVALLEQIFDPAKPQQHTFVQQLAVLGFNPNEAITVFCCQQSDSSANQVWQLRTWLQSKFEVTAFADFQGLVFAFAQRTRTPQKQPLAVELEQLKLPVVYSENCQNSAELTFQTAQCSAEATQASHTIQAHVFSLPALTLTSSDASNLQAANNFLEPLLQHKDSTLLHTLLTWFANNCQHDVCCTKLNLHRNTLRYRLHKISELLSCDLDLFQDRSSCYAALLLLRLL